MNFRTNALWACLLVASASVAQQKIYTIKKGDTPEKIARIAGVSAQGIRAANPGLKEERLQIGQKIKIPTAEKSAVSKVSKKVTAPHKRDVAGVPQKVAVKKIVKKPAVSGYVVRNGDHDESISLRYGISAHKLRAMNPGVNWERLQIGQRLNVPGSAKVASTGKPNRVASSGKGAKVTLASHRTTKFGPTHKHIVREGENDWIIARKGGITVAKLHKVNPGVNWQKVHPGQQVNIPSSTKSGRTYASIPTRRAVVNASNVYVRSKPSTDSADLRKVGAGAVGTILDREKGWYKLRFASGSTGWVKGTLLKPVTASAYVASNKKPASNQVARRSNYRQHYASNTPAPRSSKNPIVKSSGSYVSSRPVSSTALIDKAYDYLGVRYHYGGTSRSGIDCSGFARAVYSSQGIKLPRTSIEQSKVGKSVKPGELKQGDLVFFRTRGGSRVSHVGVYVGNGKFIHASSGRGQVTTSNLSDGYYSRRFAGARRVSSKLTKTSKPEDDDRKAMVKAEKQLSKGGDGVDPMPEEKKSNLGTDEPTR